MSVINVGPERKNKDLVGLPSTSLSNNLSGVELSELVSGVLLENPPMVAFRDFHSHWP